MTHNFEFSTGIALFILEKAVQSHFPYHYGGAANRNHLASGEHSRLAALQRGWEEMCSENINNLSQLF
jgi:hypothetical protein